MGCDPLAERRQLHIVAVEMFQIVVITPDGGQYEPAEGQVNHLLVDRLGIAFLLDMHLGGDDANKGRILIPDTTHKLVVLPGI